MPLSSSYALSTKIIFTTLLTGALFLLSACGGSSSDSEESNFLGGTTDSNVALASAGAVASANYNGVVAGKVIDGDTSTSEFWSGNVTNDFVSIDFGQTRSIIEIYIYTSDTSFNSAQPNKLIELSADGNNWFSTAQLSGGDISCQNFSLNATRIYCRFSARQDVRFFKFTTKASGNNAALLNVYEMQAIGK